MVSYRVRFVGPAERSAKGEEVVISLMTVIAKSADVL